MTEPVKLVFPAFIRARQSKKIPKIVGGVSTQFFLDFLKLCKAPNVATLSYLTFLFVLTELFLPNRVQTEEDVAEPQWNDP